MKWMNVSVRFRKWELIRRDIKHFFQRTFRGYDDSCTWDLNDHLAALLLPRLKLFKELNCGHPCDMTSEEWDEKIDMMIAAFDVIMNGQQLGDEGWSEDKERENDAIVERGLKEFAEHYRSLWW